jgi:hypothetical protein
MSVFYKCSIADSLLIKGRLTPGCNGIHIQVHVISPLAFSHIDKMNQVTASQCGPNPNRDTKFSTMMNTLRNYPLLAKCSCNDVNVPVKTVTLLFPPPFTCNNRAFNETKTSKLPPGDGFDLKPYICITTSMTKMSMDETLKDLALDMCDDTMDVDKEDGDDGRERKRTRALVVKDVTKYISALKKLQTFVMYKVDFCVFIVFQMAINTDLKRQLYKAGDDETADDVNEWFSNINLGKACCSMWLFCPSCFSECRG